MKIKDLPFGVVWKLCRYLDSPNAEKFSWKALLSHAPHCTYNTLDVGAFQRAGHRPNGSPTEAVLQDFISRGFTVDDLFLMLSRMGHVEGMKILKEYASTSNHHLLAESLEENKPLQRHSTGTGRPNGESLFDIDPRYGPLPPDVSPRGPYLLQYLRQGESEGEGVKVEVGVGGSGGTEKKGLEGEGGRESGGPSSLPKEVNMPYPVPHPPPQSHSGFTASGYGTGTSSEGPQAHYPYPVSNDYVNFHKPLPSNAYQQTSPPGGAQYQAPPPDHAHYHQHLVHSQPPSYGHQPLPSPGAISASSSEFSAFSPVVQSGNSATPTYSYSSQNPSSDSRSSSLNSHLTPYSHPSSSSVTSSSAFSDVQLPNILHFSFTELSAATGGFTVGLVGMGSFGSVYKAMVRGTGPYAVKKLHNESEFEGEMFYEVFHRDTFLQELQMLTKYHHRNILSLVAYSNDGHRPCLIYEYMENGSLADCLRGRQSVPLSWEVRLSIADQIADALHFLHTVNHPKCLVHGDVKSANILLDSHLVPRLSDFGLARECTTRTSQRSTYSTYSTKSEVIMGTVAYMAPEFFRNRKLSPKMDVYSFGVVLLELFTGLAADDPTSSQRALTDRLCHLFGESVLQSSVQEQADPHAGWPGNVGCGLFDIATVCVRPKAKDRPNMEQVKFQISDLANEMNLAQLHISSPPVAPPPYSYP